jgi:hypothetical protein
MHQHLQSLSKLICHGSYLSKKCGKSYFMVIDATLNSTPFSHCDLPFERDAVSTSVYLVVRR